MKDSHKPVCSMQNRQNEVNNSLISTLAKQQEQSTTNKITKKVSKKHEIYRRCLIRIYRNLKHVHLLVFEEKNRPWCEYILQSWQFY